ncbi:MAG TPA: T9SS type A sorting domain-containing protein [Bacteroidia bacterium]|nr:T9SS type A sorting domain-containing protein [Bacteroidia bacterium]
MRHNPPAMRPTMRMYQRQRVKTRTLSAQRIIFTSSILISVVLGFILFINLSDSKFTKAAANGDYRSASSGNWSSAGTWEKFNGTSWEAASSSPTSADGVIEIQSGHVVTISVDVTADQLSINSGGALAVNATKYLYIADGTGTDLVVNGTLNINGYLTQNVNSTIELNGTAVLGSSGSAILQIETGATFTINNGGTFTTNGGALPTTSGKWIVNSGGTYISSANGDALPYAAWNTGSTCEITGVSNNGVTNLNQTFYNFKWNCISQASAVNFAGALTTINGDFTLSSTGSSDIALSNAINSTINLSGNYTQTGGTIKGNTRTGGKTTLNVAGNWTHTGGTFTVGGNVSTVTTIVFNKSGIQTFTASGGTISGNVDITVNSTSTLDIGTSTVSCRNFTASSGSTLCISSASGIVTSGSPNISVSGTTNFSSSSNYIFNGTAAQVTGAGFPSTVNNLTVNNSSGVTLSNNVTVAGTLALTSGIVTTGSYELKTTNTSVSSITGYSSSNYVIGYLRRRVSANGSYDFPVGTAANYELVNVTLAGMTGFTEILSSFTNASPINIALPLTGVSITGTEITDMLDYGYWTLTPNSLMLGGTYSVTLNEKGHGNSAAEAAAYCVLKRENALFSWQSLGTHDNLTQSETGGVAVATRSGLTSFSQFGIGKGAGPLPIELVYFSAKPEGSIVKCSWQTASEVNNDYFTIERSTNGKDFAAAGTVDGAGNSSTTLTYSFTDETPAGGISYYRLKQTDFDGMFSYSKIKSVIFKTEKTDEVISISSVAPNPFTENFSVTYSMQQEAEVNISLMNASGQIVYNQTQTALQGINRFDYTEGFNLPNGMYFVKISFDKNVQVQRIVKN